MSGILNVDDEETLKLLIRESVREGIRAYHEELRITPDHWAYLREEYDRSKVTGHIIRRALIGTILAAALVFGYNVVTDYMAKILSHHIQQQELKQ